MIFLWWLMLTVRLSGYGVIWKTNLWTSEIFYLGLIKIGRPILNVRHTILWAGSSDLS